MKGRVILSVLMITSVLAFGQTGGNGGQYAENNFAKINYAGYQSGKYVASFTNKSTCITDFNFNWLGNDSTITVVAGATITVELPGVPVGNTKIKTKPLAQCTHDSDMGWLEIWSPTSLAVHFKSFTAKKGKKNS